MTVYADSSFLVAVFKRGDHAGAVARYMASQPQPLPFNPLHRLEVRNAIRLGVKRQEINGLFVHSPINWTECLRRAEALSAAHTETLGCRAMDILRVVIALEDGARTFLSSDANQRALAAAEGLTVQP